MDSQVTPAADTGAAAPGAREVPRLALTIMLEGGFKTSLEVKADDPILTTLHGVLTDFSGTRQKQLLQVQTDNGKSLLTFPCSRLVAVHTEPLSMARKRLATGGRLAATAPAQLQRNVEPARVLILDDFFTAETRAALLAYALANQSRYQGSVTSTNAADYRDSLVLHDFPEYAEVMRKAIRQQLTQIQADLGCAALAETIEAQLTAHNDGHFYKVHNDNGHPQVAQRELTYVYYFYRHPKAFTGGELKVYDSKIESNMYHAADTFQLIEPRDNRLVFFLSRLMHEVLPIVCPSRQFPDSRFTLNGWVHRAQER